MTAATQTKEFTSDMFKQATDAFNQTMQTGIRFQEEATKFWTDTFGKGAEQFQSQMERIRKETFPMATENLSRFHRTFDEQTRKSMDMLMGAWHNVQPFGGQQNIFEQTTHMWQSSFDAMRSTVDMMTKANMEMMENWAEATKACSAAPHKGGNGKSATAK